MGNNCSNRRPVTSFSPNETPTFRFKDRDGGIRQISVITSGSADVKCPVCSKMLPSDDIECHLVMCLTKPRVKYNSDILTDDKGECVICFDEMCKGDTIARLPCLCIYHRECIDKWFHVNRSCPEHPSN